MLTRCRRTARPHPTNRRHLYIAFLLTRNRQSTETLRAGNIKLDGVVEHRTKHKANYALIVAPGYSEGALAVRCAQQKVTPITAKDLGTLLEYTVQYGAIPLTIMEEMFKIYDPQAVSGWVTGLRGRLKASRPLTIDTC